MITMGGGKGMKTEGTIMALRGSLIVSGMRSCSPLESVIGLG